MHDAIILSDLHLGSPNCQAKALSELLESLKESGDTTRKLILNGDVFDSFDFRRLKKHHWKVLSLLRKLSDELKIIWICGNHDGSAEIVSHLLGVKVVDEYVLRSGRRRILVLHGHQFDDWLDTHPILTWIADMIYLFLQRIDRSHEFAKMAKKGSKTFVRCAQKIKHGSIEYAARKHCDAVCCGHTHLASLDQSQRVAYYNCGCWTEHPCTYVVVENGEIEFRHWSGDDQKTWRRKTTLWTPHLESELPGPANSSKLQNAEAVTVVQLSRQSLNGHGQAAGSRCSP